MALRELLSTPIAYGSQRLVFVSLVQLPGSPAVAAEE